MPMPTTLHALKQAHATEPGPFDAGTLIAAGLRTVANIGKAWKLSAAEMGVLLGVSRATYFRLKERAEAEATAPVAKAAQLRESLVSQPLRERLSLILGIYAGLQIIYSNNRAYGEEWVRRPNTNPVFGGKRPIDTMLTGNVLDLALVRRFVDAMLG